MERIAQMEIFWNRCPTATNGAITCSAWMNFTAAAEAYDSELKTRDRTGALIMDPIPYTHFWSEEPEAQRARGARPMKSGAG